MSYQLDGIWYCDICGKTIEECEKLTLQSGVCYTYNAMVKK